MLKSLIALIVMMFSLASFASPLEHTMSTKERLRLSLWFEGLEVRGEKTTSQAPQPRLPEEIERPLRKL